MENVNESEQTAVDPNSFEVTRILRGSKAKSIVGFFLFINGLANVIFLVTMACTAGADAGLVVLFVTISSLSFIVGAALQVKKSEEGTLTFYPDKMVFSGTINKLELYASEISVAQKKADVLKIVAARTTLVITAVRAEDIALKIREMLHTADGDDSVAATEQPSDTEDVQPVEAAPEKPAEPSITDVSASTPAEKAEALREYKKLVDEGVLTKEQFDEIVKKLV